MVSSNLTIYTACSSCLLVLYLCNVIMVVSGLIVNIVNVFGMSCMLLLLWLLCVSMLVTIYKYCVSFVIMQE